MHISPNTHPYWEYLRSMCPTITPDSLPAIAPILATTNWDDPQTPLDWNNYGVMALIEAEQTTDLTLRGLYLETAIAAFDRVANAHLLCNTQFAG